VAAHGLPNLILLEGKHFGRHEDIFAAEIHHRHGAARPPVAGRTGPEKGQTSLGTQVKKDARKKREGVKGPAEARPAARKGSPTAPACAVGA